jgi:hypothetical protein
MEQPTFEHLKSVLDDLNSAIVFIEGISNPRSNVFANRVGAKQQTERALQKLQAFEQSKHITKALNWVTLALERLQQDGAKADWPTRSMLVAAEGCLQPELSRAA